MYKGKKVFTVSTGLNEALFIEEVINTMPEFVDRMIVLDDGSTDGMADVVKKMKNPRVELIINEKNLGAGASVTKGYNLARSMGADIAVSMAADGQMDPQYLSLILDEVVDNGYDFAKGNRFYSKDAFSNMPFLRVVGNIGLTFLTKMASGYWDIFDAQNGYYAMGPRVLHQLDFDSMTKGWPFENDLLIHMNILGMRVKDVPIPAVYGEEISDIKIHKIIVPFVIFLVRRFFYRIFRKYVMDGFHPIALFMSTGSLLFGWGLLFGIYEIIVHWGKAPAATGIVMLAVLPFLMGFQLLLQAFVLDIQEGSK